MTRTQKLALSALVVLGAVFGLLGLLRHRADRPAGIRVVASFYPLGYFAERIVGDLGTVRVVTPAGAEPHDYEPTPGDVAAMHDAQLVILNGGGLESWGSAVTTQLAGSATRVLVAGTDLATKQLDEDGIVGADPHVWLDPALAKRQAAAITVALAAADPVHDREYRLSGDRLAAELDALDTEYRQGLSECASRTIVTGHEAFAYLAARYGLTQVGIAGLSPDEEPSPQQLATVADFVRSHGVTTVFFESLASPKFAETLAAETGATTDELNPIEGLTADEVAAGDTYATVMRANLGRLQKALGCQNR